MAGRAVVEWRTHPVWRMPCFLADRVGRILGLVGKTAYVQVLISLITYQLLDLGLIIDLPVAQFYQL